jgi:hypothetical protein
MAMEYCTTVLVSIPIRDNQDNQRSVGKEHFRRSMQPLELGYVMEAMIFFEKKESRIIDSCSLRDSQGSTAV